MSTFSPNLAIQLIATGDQAGQWGLTTNVNLGTLIESAISGYVTQSFSDANITLPMPPGADGGNGSVSNPVAARNMFITCQGTNTAQRNLFVPNNTKLYFISNQTTGGFGINVTTIGGTGVVVPNGQTALLVCNGINVVNAITFFPVLSPTVTIPSPTTLINSLIVNGIPNAISTLLNGGAGLQVVTNGGSSFGVNIFPSTTAQIPGILIGTNTQQRTLELLYPGTTSGGSYGSPPGIPVINSQGGLTFSIGDIPRMSLTTNGGQLTLPNVPNNVLNSGNAALFTSGAPSGGVNEVKILMNGIDSLNLGVEQATGPYIAVGGGLQIRTGGFTSGQDRIVVGASGNTVFEIPSASVPCVTINGANGSNTLNVIAQNTASNSFGLFIAAGTNANDRALDIFNGAQTSLLFRVWGDGGVQIGTPSTFGRGPGSLNASLIYINGDQIYSGVPPSSSTTISRLDINKCVVAASDITVPNGVFNEGDCVSVYNDTGSNINIIAGIGTMRLVGTATTGSRVLAQRGLATIWFRSSSECVVSGGGVT